MSYYKGYPSYKGHPRTEVSNVRITNETNVNLTSYNDDAFGRLRTSNPYTLFDFTFVFDKDRLHFDEEISGNASSTHNAASYINMSVNAENGASVIRQTREYIPYQPGKSKLVYLTGLLTNNLTTNITSRLGSFDQSCGNFFEYSDGTISFVERDNENEIRIPRNEWIDSLNGRGPSKVNVDFTKAQIFWLDQEWLGIGRVRAGIIVNGVFYQCVNLSHNGASAVEQPYYRMAKLPIRYEIQSHGEAGSMRMICGSVMSEGGFNHVGKQFGSSTIPLRSISTTNGLRPVFSLRLRDISGSEPHLYATIKIKSFDILNIDNSKVLSWKLLWNPNLTLVNGSFVDYNPDYSSAQICTHGSNDLVSGGVVLSSGIAEQKQNFFLNITSEELVHAIGIGRSIRGISDTITLAAQALTGTPEFYTSLSWVEIR